MSPSEEPVQARHWQLTSLSATTQRSTKYTKSSNPTFRYTHTGRHTHTHTSMHVRTHTHTHTHTHTTVLLHFFTKTICHKSLADRNLKELCIRVLASVRVIWKAVMRWSSLYCCRSTCAGWCRLWEGTRKTGATRISWSTFWNHEQENFAIVWHKKCLCWLVSAMGRDEEYRCNQDKLVLFLKKATGRVSNCMSHQVPVLADVGYGKGWGIQVPPG